MLWSPQLAALHWHNSPRPIKHFRLGRAYVLDDTDLVAEYLQVVTASSVVTADRRYQVFLSSTYSDLADVRQAVVQQILKMDRYIPAGMELFSASPQPPWDVITSALAGTDYMVLILGTRYGSIVPGENISYTEKEYNYALEHEIPVLAFIGAEDRMVPADSAESATHRRLLKKFRDRVAGSSTIEHWSTDTDLPAKVITALTKAVQTTTRPGWIRGGPGGISAVGKTDPSAQTAPKLTDPQLKEPPKSAIDNIKDWIRDPTKSVRIEELLLDQTKDLVLKIQRTPVVLEDGETLYGRYEKLLDLTLPLIELATTAIRYDQANDYAGLWPKVAKKLLTGRSKMPSAHPYERSAERSRSLPALYFVRCAGMALLENNAETAYIKLLTEPKFREPEYNRVVDALLELQDYELLDRDEINSHSGGSGWMYPPSHFLRQVLRGAMEKILPEDEDYQLAQNRFEHRRAFIEFSEYDYVTPGEFIGERSMMTNDASDQLAFEKSAARPDSPWRKYFAVPDDLENSLQRFQDQLAASRRGF